MRERNFENMLAIAFIVFACIGIYACIDDHLNPRYQQVHHERD